MSSVPWGPQLERPHATEWLVRRIISLSRFVTLDSPGGLVINLTFLPASREDTPLASGYNIARRLSFQVKTETFAVQGKLTSLKSLDYPTLDSRVSVFLSTILVLIYFNFTTKP
jgi:hypothetical protein